MDAGGVEVAAQSPDRDAPLLPRVAIKLLEATGHAALALAVADEI